MARLLNSKLHIGYLIVFNLALRILFLNSPANAYFDEKAFYLEGARSYLTGFTDPNFEQPPLGKEIIALGIKIFGDNPWGWRLPAVFFATIGVVVTYLLAKKLFKSTKIALFAALFLTFDAMWFVNSRIGTIEIFQATFILLTSYFFWEFTQQRDYIRHAENLSFRSEDESKRIHTSTAWLIKLKENPSFKAGEVYKSILLTGSFLGASVATKWSGLFLVLGLAGWFFLNKKASIPFSKLLLGLLVAFLVYLGSYSPYLQNHSLTQFLDRQKQIYQFHTEVVSDQAPTAQRPLNWLFDPAEIYYQKGDQLVTSLVNPVLFYGGLISMGYWFSKGFRKLGGSEQYLLALILGLYLPWFLVRRYTFFYYFLPITPFLAILLAKTIFAEKLIKLKESWWGWLQFSIVTGNLLGFIICYPLLVGLPVTSHYLAVILSAKIH